MATVCAVEAAKPAAPLRQHTANSSQSSSGSSDRPAYRLFPVIDSTQPGSTPRYAERRRSALLDESAGVTKKSLGARRGKKINISIKKAAKAAASLRSSPSTSRSASPSIYTVQRERSSDHGRSDSAQEDAASIQLSPTGTESSSASTWASKQAALHTANVRGLSLASSTSSIQAEDPKPNEGAAPANDIKLAPTASDPVPKSPIFQHKRQASSVSTMASICDGAILELPSMNARASTAAGSEMRVREVMVSAPSTRRTLPPPITIVTLPDGDVEKPKPLFTPGVGSWHRSSPSDESEPTSASDLAGERTPKATSFFDIKRPATMDSTPTPQSVYMTPSETEPSTSPQKLRDRETLRVLTGSTPSPSPLEGPYAGDAPTRQLPDVPASTFGGRRPSQAPTRANLVLAMADVSKQSETLHARYASLRAERLKLTMSIAALLRDGQVGPDTTHALLDQHMSLNAINSSMDICFAKLKSLGSQKDEAIAQLSALADARAVTNVKVEAAQALLVAQMSAASSRLAGSAASKSIRPAQELKTPAPNADEVDSARTTVHMPQGGSPSVPLTPTTVEKSREVPKASDLTTTASAATVKAKSLRVEVVNIKRSPSTASKTAPLSPAAASLPGSDSWPAELEAPLVSPVKPVTASQTIPRPTTAAVPATTRAPIPTERPTPAAAASVPPPTTAPATTKPPTTPRIGSNKRIPRGRTAEPLPPLPPLSTYQPQTPKLAGLPPRRAPPPPPSSTSTLASSYSSRQHQHQQRHRRHVPEEDSMASLSTASGGSGSSVSSGDGPVTPRSSFEADGGDGLGPLLAIRANPRDPRAVRKSAGATTAAVAVPGGVPLRASPVQVMSTEAHAFSQFCEGLFAYKA